MLEAQYLGRCLLSQADGSVPHGCALQKKHVIIVTWAEAVISEVFQDCSYTEENGFFFQIFLKSIKISILNKNKKETITETQINREITSSITIITQV